MTDQILLVAHRGQPDSFPENSLEGFMHVLQSGAVYIEADIQVTADGVVVLSHDKNLRKLTGKNINIMKHDYAEFKNIPAGCPKKFSDRFNHSRIATLKQFSDLLQNWPKVNCFIEIKQDSLDYFGNKVVDLVVDALQAIDDQSVLISRDYDALVYARDKYHRSVGWVLPCWSKENQVKAGNLSPDYLFIKTAFCSKGKKEFLTGSWKWVVYTVNTVKRMKRYSDLGIHIIETNCFSELKCSLDIINDG